MQIGHNIMIMCSSKYLIEKKTVSFSVRYSYDAFLLKANFTFLKNHRKYFYCYLNELK